MTRKLNDADRAAVDLLLDQANAADAGEGVMAMTGSIEMARLASAEEILKVLEAMPAPEPSADLAVRTLQRIARTAGTMSVIPTYVDPTQPLA